MDVPLSTPSAVLDIVYIFVYEAACAIFLPLPSEAPMFLFPRLSRITVLIACALGKGFGSYIVFRSGGLLKESKAFLKFLAFIRLDSLWVRFFAWSEGVMKTYGLLGFLVFMSVPGMPMRSSIYSASMMKINAFQFSLGSAIGTIIRCSLVYGGYKLIS